MSPIKMRERIVEFYYILGGGGRRMRKLKKVMAVLLAMVLMIAGLYGGNQSVRAENVTKSTQVKITIADGTTVPQNYGVDYAVVQNDEAHTVVDGAPSGQVTTSDYTNINFSNIDGSYSVKIQVQSGGLGIRLNGADVTNEGWSEGKYISITALQSEYNFELFQQSQNPGGNGGNNNGNQTYNIDFSDGTINGYVISYTIGESTVTATLPDTINLSNNVASLSENDEITLSDNYNAETMQVRVYASDGFSTTLAVENGKTKLANKQGDGGLPNDLKLVVEAKNNAGGGNEPGGNEPGGNEPGGNTFSGTVYFVWQGIDDKLCIHKFENLTSGWTDDTTNYFNISDVKDDSTNEAFTMSAANTVYWMWDNAEEFLPNYQTYSSMKETLEANENTKRSYAIDPCGFENSGSCVGTYGDRQFRAVIVDNTRYEAISFSADVNDYTYFPRWWDPILFTSTVDISNTTKENPAIYEAFVEEPNIKFATGANSLGAITSVTALDVPSGAVSVSESNGEWTINYASNFYDHVVFEVKTSTETYYVEIERVAIQVHDNFGPNTAEADEKIICEMYYPTSQNASDYDVYATIFYSDGSKKMQKLTATATNNNGGTGLYFAEYEISYTSDMVGIAYNAVEAGSLFGNTFGGAYLGSGTGTYYDIDAREIKY